MSSKGPAGAERRQRRLSTPVVLALVSAMVSVGVLALLASRPEPAPAPATAARVEVLDDTPEHVAESFLDAWRKREHGVADALSLGPAQARVRARQAADGALAGPERELKQKVWDAMATERLEFFVEESERLAGGRLALRGTAEGTFLDAPYERALEFITAPAGDGWRVEDVTFGPILSEVPELLKLEE
ncbi:MAG: hypothetical protein AAF447_14640 [Myxococcota bacterium]